MTIEDFNFRYRKQGGIQRLSEMRDAIETLESISREFGVAKETVRLWMINIFGVPYDPRKKRREDKIKAIQELIKIHGVEKTKDLYQGVNKSYLEEAIKNL